MSMKMNTEKVKTKSVKRFSKTLKVSLLLFFVIIGVLGLNFYNNYSLNQTVDIVKLQSSVPQDGVVTQDNMVKDSMLKSEFEKQGVVTLADGSKKRAIVLWEDKDKIQDAFASYYIRQNTPLYWDSLSKETPRKYSYLYKMDGELLKVSLDAEEFGKMLVPGDRINVRAAYSENEYVLPSERDFALQQQMGIQPQTTVDRNVMLFNNVVVLDILNSNGESIFDIYYQLLALPQNQQRSTVGTPEFQAAVVPSEILLNVTPEEADRYMAVSNKNPQLMMTLLPRTSGNLITEALNELQIGFARD